MEKQKILEDGSTHFQTRSSSQDQTMASGKEVNIIDEPATGGPASDQSVVPGEDVYEYLSGFKLILVMSTVTMVAFLVLLDSSVVATVRQPS